MLKDWAIAAVSNDSRFVYDEYFAEIFNGTNGTYPLKNGETKPKKLDKSSDFMAAFVGFALSELGDKTFLCVLLLTLLWADIREKPATNEEEEEANHESKVEDKDEDDFKLQKTRSEVEE